MNINDLPTMDVTCDGCGKKFRMISRLLDLPKKCPSCSLGWGKEYTLGEQNENNETPQVSPCERVSKVEYYLDMAEVVSKRGTCLRRKFGAVIVKNDRVVSTGYVGAPRGRQNCCDIGRCFRIENNIPSGTRYELCRSVHAEMNAIIQASSEEMEGAVLYLAGVENDGSITNGAEPCAMCKRMIINAGIRYVIVRTATGYRTFDVDQWVSNDDSLDIDHKGY